MTMFKIEENSYGFDAHWAGYSAFPDDAELIWDKSVVEERIEKHIQMRIQQLVDQSESNEYNYEDWDSEEELTCSWKPSIEDFEVKFSDHWQYGADLTIECCLHNDEDHPVWGFRGEAYEELRKIVQQLDIEDLYEAINAADVFEFCYYPDYGDEDSIKWETEKARAAGWVYDPEGFGGYGEWKRLEEETA